MQYVTHVSSHSRSLWALESGELIRVLEGHTNQVSVARCRDTTSPLVCHGNKCCRSAPDSLPSHPLGSL